MIRDYLWLNALKFGLLLCKPDVNLINWSGHPITVPLLCLALLPDVSSFISWRWVSISSVPLPRCAHSRPLQPSLPHLHHTPDYTENVSLTATKQTRRIATQIHLMVTISFHSGTLYYVCMVFEEWIRGSLSDKGQRAEQTLPHLGDLLWSHDPASSSLWVPTHSPRCLSGFVPPRFLPHRSDPHQPGGGSWWRNDPERTAWMKDSQSTSHTAHHLKKKINPFN